MSPLREEVVDLLRALVRLDTVNPPGNETRAAELLRDYLELHGVDCALYGRVPERANLVARLPGRDPGAPRLLLLGHTDTVVADPAEWTVDPWSGELRDAHVWGRGALDMKGQVAAAAVALATLAREGFRPSGDLILAAVADEEVGDGYGLSWLCETHPEAVRATWCVNEGSGDRIEVAGRPLYLCSTAEKATAPFTVRVTGKSGHASMPSVADNALLRAAPLIERLGRVETRVSVGPETEAFLEALVGPGRNALDALDALRRTSPAAAAMLEPMLRATVAPTQISASARINVVPGACEITCDCRLLPGQARADVEADVRAALGPDGYELRWAEPNGGTRSALGTPLWEACARFVGREEPGATLVPMLLPGFTDSHYLRQAFGTIAYGFFPMRTMHPQLAASLIHSADERIHVEDLELGTRFLVEVARELLA